VHLYRVMRLYFPGIKASTPEEAAKIAATDLVSKPNARRSVMAKTWWVA
jgi:hypothetical protein